jgi:hypothetical protein
MVEREHVNQYTYSFKFYPRIGKVNLNFYFSCCKMLSLFPKVKERMEPARILAKAEAWKKKAHRLSMELRLKSLAEARRFLREHSVVLWNVKAELPNLLDAILGRIANGKERQQGKPAENCLIWRKQLLDDPDFIDCLLFRKQVTVIHQDLWPSVTVFSRVNENGRSASDLSRDARKILGYLKKEGPTDVPQIRRNLRYQSGPESRIFKSACSELLSLLLVVAKQGANTEGKPQIILDTWENAVPRSVKSAADKLKEDDAGIKLLAATLNSSVLSNEKGVPEWFPWQRGQAKEWLDSLVETRTFVRIKGKSGSWIIPRKIIR